MLMCGHFIKMALTFENFLYLLGSFVAAFSNGGANASIDIAGQRTKAFVHCLYSSKNDATCCPTPTSMCYAADLLYWIVEEYRRTIRKGQCHGNATFLRNDCISLAD